MRTYSALQRKIGSYIKKNSRFDVQILDFNWENFYSVLLFSGDLAGEARLRSTMGK